MSNDQRHAFKPAPVKPTIAFETFEQIDVRVGTILSVTDIPGSDKLVALRVDFGDHQRTIVAGLRQERARPAEIEGRTIAVTIRTYCHRLQSSELVRRTLGPMLISTGPGDPQQ